MVVFPGQPESSPGEAVHGLGWRPPHPKGGKGTYYQVPAGKGSFLGSVEQGQDGRKSADPQRCSLVT